MDPKLSPLLPPHSSSLQAQSPPLADISVHLGKRKDLDSSAAFCEALLGEALVSTVPGNAFGLEGHARISFCLDQAALQTGMDRLEAFVTGLSPQ